MRVFWTGIGLIAALIFVVVPLFSKISCRARWSPLEIVWSYEHGCMVNIRGILYLEENVSVGPLPSRPLN
jgi:hypothetical protein